MADRTALTVRATRNWAWTRAYNLQLSTETRDQYFPDVSHGDHLLLEAEHDGVTFEMFGKVDQEGVTHLDPGEVGIGLNLRYALGVSPGDLVRI